MLLSILFMYSTLPTVILHPDGAEEYALSGAAHDVQGHELNATLWIACVPKDLSTLRLDVAISADADLIDLVNHQDAVPASPSRLTWTNQKGASSISLPAKAFHSPGYVQFDITESEKKPRQLMPFFQQISGSGTLKWEQGTFRDSPRAITFETLVDGEAAKNVQVSIGRCLNPRPSK